jgi:glycosyltransferase involved in cell wall biosynthesis
VWVQLRAAEIVCNRLPDVSFRFVGSFNDPHLGGLARSFCRSRPALDRSVEFVDRLPYDGVLKALAEADIGCIPRLDCAQHRKCIPTKLFEYMCFGLPVVASDLPSIRRYLGGERCGLLVPPGDHRALAAALLRLLGDPTERRRLGERGRRAVRERLNWSSEERSLLRLYDDLLAEGVGPAVPDGSLG